MASEEYDLSLIVKRGNQETLDKSKFAMSSEETRYYLNGLFTSMY